VKSKNGTDLIYQQRPSSMLIGHRRWRQELSGGFVNVLSFLIASLSRSVH